MIVVRSPCGGGGEICPACRRRQGQRPEGQHCRPAAPLGRCVPTPPLALRGRVSAPPVLCHRAPPKGMEFRKADLTPVPVLIEPRGARRFESAAVCLEVLEWWTGRISPRPTSTQQNPNWANRGGLHPHRPYSHPTESQPEQTGDNHTTASRSSPLSSRTPRTLSSKGDDVHEAQTEGPDRYPPPDMQVFVFGRRSG